MKGSISGRRCAGRFGSRDPGSTPGPTEYERLVMRYRKESCRSLRVTLKERTAVSDGDRVLVRIQSASNHSPQCQAVIVWRKVSGTPQESAAHVKASCRALRERPLCDAARALSHCGYKVLAQIQPDGHKLLVGAAAHGN